MPVLRNPRPEVVAQELAAGRSTAEASHEAGYPAGSSFSSNARKRAQRPGIRARVAEIQTRGAELAAIEAAWRSSGAGS
jgi:hypothetical protein